MYLANGRSAKFERTKQEVNELKRSKEEMEQQHTIAEQALRMELHDAKDSLEAQLTERATLEQKMKEMETSSATALQASREGEGQRTQSVYCSHESNVGCHGESS